MTQIKDGTTFHLKQNVRRTIMQLSDTQVFIALVVALIPGIMAIRLSTELYK